MVKKLNGIKTDTKMPLKENGASVFEDLRKAEILATSLDETLGEEPTQITEEQKRKIQETKELKINEEINSRFTMKELK